MATTAPIEVGVGLALTFKKNEIRDLEIMLREYGYTPDSAGLKDFILDSIYEESEPAAQNLGDKIAQALNDNPELTDKLKKMGTRWAVNFAKKKFKL